MRHLDSVRRNDGAAACVVIAVLFLSAQFFGIAHAAHHGDPSHHHDDLPCAIQFAVDSARSLIAPVANTETPKPLVSDIQPERLTALVYRSRETSHGSIRGPPRLLF